MKMTISSGKGNWARATLIAGLLLGFVASTPGAIADDCTLGLGDPDLPFPSIGELAGLQGSSEWEVAAVYEDACTSAELLAIPAGVDTGTMTDPFGLSYSGDKACTKWTASGGPDFWRFFFTLTATFGDASYTGRLPFGLVASSVSFDLPEDSASWPKNGAVEVTALGDSPSLGACEGLLFISQKQAYSEAAAWIAEKGTEWIVPATCHVAYISQVGGDYLVTLDGVDPFGRIAVEPGLGSAATAPLVGIKSWSFDVACPLEIFAPSAESQGAHFLLKGRGSSFGLAVG